MILKKLYTGNSIPLTNPTNYYFRIILMFVVIPIIISMIMVSRPAVAENNNAPVVVCLTQDAYAEVDDIETIHTIDYGSFIWIELTSSNFEQLVERGVEFERKPDPAVLKLQGCNLDTNELSPESGVGFHVVQLIGPTKDEWLAVLKDAGLEILQYFQPHAYLVWMTPEQVSVIEVLDFVRWVGPYLPEYRIASDLLERSGTIENVDVTVYGQADYTLNTIQALGGTLIEREIVRDGDVFITATFALPAEALTTICELDNVIWLSYRPPVDPLEDEMSDQIIAGNFNPSITTGYQTWLTANGVDGTGVTVALIDTGYDTGTDTTSHQDVSGRLIPVGTPTDTNGHGTHVGGIMVGNANLGTTDVNSFLLGLGVAPAANMVVRTNTGTDGARQRDAVVNGAIASNNSYRIHAPGIGYTSRDRTLDQLVRDADQTTATVAEPLVIVFSAGNSGAAGTTKEAKNIIAVANSLNQRATDGTPNTANINNLRGSSSRGPAGDGRIYPHLTAPGTNIVSTHSTQGTASCNTIATGAGAPAADPTYSMCTGTSMAAPHVTGAVALITQWWMGLNALAIPSPAMVKALLVNGAVDMGTADIPNGNEGWGRINLSNVIGTGVPTEYVDQTTVFTSTGNTWSQGFSPANASQPLKITLAWSDAPGPGTGGNPAALVNDLDLVVSDSSSTYLGNVFANGFSTTGGTADGVDNLENVFIQNQTDCFTITITAAGINGDGVPYNGDTTDQDFALVCFNCIPNEPPVCNAKGPYTGECTVTLDGTDSSDPEGCALTYSWTTDCPGGSFDDANSATPVLTVSPTCNINCNVTLTVTDILGASASCSTTVTIDDTTPPVLSGVPADITVECDSVPNAANPTATDNCSAPTITFGEVRTDGDCPSNYTLTRTWTATDSCGNSSSQTQVITVQDTTPPVITCNTAPGTITPPDAPISFTATAIDNCDPDPIVVIVDPDCFKFTKKGKQIDKKESCEVQVDGDTITILDSGGVGDRIEWTVQATDKCGNVEEVKCGVDVVNPAGK